MRVRLKHDRLAQALARRQISQNRWAQILGLSAPHLSMLVNGRREYPSAETRRKLLEGLQLEFDDLFVVETPAGWAARRKRMRPVGSPRTELAERRSPVNDFFRDIRYALRVLGRQPALSCTMVLTLALGIGANSAIFSVVNGVLLRPLPFRSPDRLVMVWSSLPGSNVERDSTSAPNYIDLAERSECFQGTAGMGYPFTVSLTDAGEPAAVKMSGLTPGFFELLGISPGLGREFRQEDLPGARQGNSGVTQATPLILSHGLWASRFGSDPSILGRKVQINKAPATVIGIMPSDLRFFQMLKAAGLGINDELQAWVPLNVRNVNWPRQLRTIRAVGRLKEGWTPDQAQQSVDALSERLRDEYLELAQSDFRFELVPLGQDLFERVRPALLSLLGAVGFVLLIACANVANLILSKSSFRRAEISIRAALGAGRGAILRQLLAESTVLALAGALFGLVLANWGVRGLVLLHPANLPRLDEIELDWTVLVFTLVVSLGSAFAFGLLPALQMSRPDLATTINLAGRGSSGSLGGRAASFLVVAQVALSLVLLVGAGLMVRSFANSQHADLGFRPENALSAHVSLPFSRYNTSAKQIEFFYRLQSELEMQPGVTAAGSTLLLPLDAGWWTGPYWLPGETALADQAKRSTDYRIVTPGYFGAMGNRILEGRGFREEEYRNTLPVAVVDELLARQAWPDEWPNGSVVGKAIRILPEKIPAHTAPIELRVIGVAEHMRHDHPGSDSRPTIYFPPAFSSFTTFMDVVVRGYPGADLTTSIRSSVRALDKDLPVADVRPLSGLVTDALAPLRFSLALTGLFAAIALLLSLVGLYGTLSNTVSRRTREIGLRMALGAQRSTILRQILGQALRLTLLGTVLGLIGAAALTRLISTSLHGVSPLDPVTFLAVAVALVAVALAACLIPARRATVVDPVNALRPDS